MVEIVPEIVKKYSSAFHYPHHSTFRYPVKKLLEQLPEHVSVFVESARVSRLVIHTSEASIILDHDTALEFDYSKWIKRGTGVLHARDISFEIQLPIGNQDIYADLIVNGKSCWILSRNIPSCIRTEPMLVLQRQK